MLVFCPDLSRISYKLSNSSNTFDDFFQFLFKQSYYQSDHIRIFVDRDQFYNNERINIDLVDNSKIAYNDLLLKIKDSNSNLYSQYSIREDEINGYAIPPISQPGEYSLYLLNKNQKVSNKLTVDIYKYDNEDILKGQNVDYLNRIANQTNGAYSNEYDYLRNLVNNAINYRVSYSNDIYDVKNYLLGLLFAVFALVVDWYLRKKRGLL